MGFWEKSAQIVKLLFERGKLSVRQVANETGFSKSSVHRLEQARQQRQRHPESALWETMRANAVWGWKRSASF